MFYAYIKIFSLARDYISLFSMQSSELSVYSLLNSRYYNEDYYSFGRPFLIIRMELNESIEYDVKEHA